MKLPKGLDGRKVKVSFKYKTTIFNLTDMFQPSSVQILRFKKTEVSDKTCLLILKMKIVVLYLKLNSKVPLVH